MNIGPHRIGGWHVFFALVFLALAGAIVLLHEQNTIYLELIHKVACERSLDDNLVQIEQAIENSADSRSEEHFSYSTDPQNCPIETGSVLRIVQSDSSVLCRAICGGTSGICTILIINSPSYTDSKCLRISPSTVFPDDGSCNMEGIGVPVDLKSESGIMLGDYVLVKNSGQGQSICAYKKK